MTPADKNRCHARTRGSAIREIRLISETLENAAKRKNRQGREHSRRSSQGNFVIEEWTYESTDTARGSI